jgi:hypothetical protein
MQARPTHALRARAAEGRLVQAAAFVGSTFIWRFAREKKGVG